MRYYCHHCHSQISAEDLLPDFTCPNCQSGFVEEITITQASRRSSNDRSSSRDDGTGFGSSRISSDEYSDDNSDAELMEAVGAPLAHLFGLYEQRMSANNPQQPQGSTSASTEATTAPDVLTGVARSASTSADPHAHRFIIRAPVQNRGQRSRSQDQSLLNDPTLVDVLSDFITHGPTFGNRFTGSSNTSQPNSSGVQTPAGRGMINIDVPLPLFLHSSPGDYAWGNAGFDAVITQLLNNLDGTSSGPPPMPKEQVDELPTVKISEEQVTKQGLQCTVCMEDFLIGESARQLPCEHTFHQDCIIPWLAIVSKNSLL